MKLARTVYVNGRRYRRGTDVKDIPSGDLEQISNPMVVSDEDRRTLRLVDGDDGQEGDDGSPEDPANGPESPQERENGPEGQDQVQPGNGPQELQGPENGGPEPTSPENGGNAEPAAVPEPPAGNASADEWRAYAAQEPVQARLTAAGVKIADDAKRDDVKAALEAAGVIGG